MHLPYVSETDSFPFASRIVATGALYPEEDPYRYTASSTDRGRPAGI